MTKLAVSRKVFSCALFALFLASSTMSYAQATIDVQPPILFKSTRTQVADSTQQFVVIRSTGSSDLTFTGYPNSFSFTGEGAARYSVTRLPMNPIPPGQSDTLGITFKPIIEGPAQAVLTISNNSTNKPSATVSLRGVGVVPRITVSPSRLEFDSIIAIGTSVCKDITITNVGSDTLRITKQYFSSNDGDFTYTSLKGKDTAIAPLGYKTIKICFEPLQVGTRQARLRFATNIPLTLTNPRNDTSFLEFEIRGNNVVYGELSGITKAEDTIKVLNEICRTDTLWNTGSADVLITSAVFSGPNKSAFTLSGVTMPFNIKQQEYVLYTVCTTPQQPGTLKAALTFSGVTNNKPRTFTTNYTVVSEPQKSEIAPPVLFNGISIIKDTKRTEPLTIVNTDDYITTYTATIIKGDEYTIEADPVFTLWPGMKKTLAVTFAPTAYGFMSGALKLTGTGNEDVIIPLNGTGSDREILGGVTLTEAEGFTLEQNYPNPTTGLTNFNFTVPNSATVRICLADVTGNVIKELANGRFDAGSHNVSVSTQEITSGTYLYILESNGVKLVRQMVITK